MPSVNVMTSTVQNSMHICQWWIVGNNSFYYQLFLQTFYKRF